MRCVLIAALVVAACSSQIQEHGARAKYNVALDELEQGDYEAAQKAFLEARDSAGHDPELRFRAAYNLGIAYSKQADVLVSDKPQEAIDALYIAAAWFRDAVRLRSHDEDSRVNLELVLKRAQVLADQLNKGDNTLEARLTRVIADQRTLRDRLRVLMSKIEQSGARANPVAFQNEYEQLATLERELLSRVGVVGDLAGDERAGIEGTPQDQREQQQQVRLVMLVNLNVYLQAARGSLADTRRALRRLRGDKAHRRSDAALVQLKRAREQLLDPVVVLKSIAQDQARIAMETGAKRALDSGSLKLDDKDDAQVVPAWLTSEHLADRQRDALERTEELFSRFAAADSERAVQEMKGADAKQKRLLEAAIAAKPFLAAAVSAMEQATRDLALAQLESAGGAQQTAMQQLIRAIELFSHIRDLIELIYRDHSAVATLLDPTADGEANTDMSTEERAEKVGELNARDIERLKRLEGLFDDELSTIDAEAQAEAVQGQQADPEKIEATKQRFVQAESLREQALSAIEELSRRVKVVAGGGKRLSLSEPIDDARENIVELRRLFYSVVEHLKELHRDQSETYDKTASAHAKDDDERATLLPPLATSQTEHLQMADAIAQALEEQADAATAAVAQDPKAAQQAEAFAGAAQEVRAAIESMTGASVVLTRAVEDLETTSSDLSPALEDQPVAIEHLENAIKLLEPPQQDEQQQDEEKQDEKKQQEEVSQQQAQRKLQAIRDREAERQRNKRPQVQPDPVEKDW